MIVNTDYAINKGDGLGIENSAKIVRLGAQWRFYYGGFASCCPEDATLSIATAPVKSSPNRAPDVDAGADQTVDALTANLAGTVMDDDVPIALAQVAVAWTKVSGPGTVQFVAATALATTATFSAPGVYVLRLTASDTALDGSADVTIAVGGTTLPADAGAGSGGGDSTPSAGGCCNSSLPPGPNGVLAIGVAIIALRRRRVRAPR